jgi:uncharacterized membrane protein
MLFDSYLGKIILTFGVAMMPVLELRGAIPVGVANGLDLWTAIGVSIIGNLVPVPFIIIFIRKIFDWMKKVSKKFHALVEKLENRAEEKSEVVLKYAFWGLVILVAIPLPGTGAWTGALVAAMLNMRLKKAFPAIALGVLIAAVIVSFATYGVGELLF